MEPRPRLQNNALMGYMARAHDVMHRHRVGILDVIGPISTNNIATGMVRGSQIRFQSTDSTLSIHPSETFFDMFAAHVPNR
jgi:hypothetical protein